MEKTSRRTAADPLLIGPVATLLIAVALTTLASWDGVAAMFNGWAKEEYSYGYFVPLLIAFFIWQRKNELAKVRTRGSWWGVALTFIGLFVVLFGELGTLYILIQYGFVITLHGIALTYLGWKGYRLVAVPLALMFLAIPLPNFLYNNLSQSLQLLSSEIGVWFIRQFNITVYLEGNVIHLATMQLQVVEACSGLRYLFPLMAVGFMVAYLYHAPLWKRALLFLSTIPITVLMNSLRIGLIGVTVEYWGNEMAEGILHDFEGWVVFMASLGVLLAEMFLLNKLGWRRSSFREAFHIDFPPPLSADAKGLFPPLSRPLIVSTVLVVIGVGLVSAAPQRDELRPERRAFVEFPSQLGDWTGEVERLEQIYIDALKLDDYLLADFTDGSGPPVNLYSAYYASQRKGASVHSPQSCLPGDGWKMTDLSVRSIDASTLNGQPLQVNRAVIRKGELTNLVYYWFQQRGRLMTNEYLVKWYLFQDSLLKHRTDGALVRLVTAVPQGTDVDAVDRRLSSFAQLLVEEIQPFIPN